MCYSTTQSWAVVALLQAKYNAVPFKSITTAHIQAEHLLGAIDARSA